ncbi:restriction endonuclease subunit S [Methylomonas sp. HW2-6]|uniref:restriction endonuclease subunit S n=1 Tax=Methylomonas sp. HW2-6 TaxID=3376687 RepID=UPI004041D970
MHTLLAFWVLHFTFESAEYGEWDCAGVVGAERDGWMRTAQIKQLFRIIGGKPAPKGDNAFSDEGTPFIKMKDLGRAHFSNNLIEIEQRVTDDVAKKEGLNLIRRGAILLPRSGSVALNHRAVLGIDAYMVSHICALEVIDQKEVSNLYAYYYLRSIKMDRISKKTTGLDAITFEDLGKLSIPLPHLDDQIRIAHLLGKVEGLIAQRKQHLQQLDDLLKSVFLEMFGKYLKDEHSYQPITDACDFIDCRGKTPPRIEVGVPLISAKCVRRGYFDVERLDFISEETYKSWMTRGFPKANDVLFTTEGATFGYTCRIPRDFKKFAVGQRIITLVCKKGFQPEVLEFILNDFHIQKKLSSRLSGSAALGIRSAELAKVLIPFPPYGLHDQFASIVEKVESLKSRYQQSLTDLENLYGGLSQQAFKGELDLSQVPLPLDNEAER